MARTFSSGTAVDGGGNVSTNAATIHGLVRDAIVANAAWSLVEEFTGSGGTLRHTVFKCASGASGLPKDFYVVITRTIIGGAMQLFVAEDYDAATHIATNLPPAYLSGNRTYDANGLPNPATTANLSATLTTTNTPVVQSFSVTANCFWYVVCDTDHCVISIGGQTLYSGAITSVASGAVADPMPVASARLSWSTQAPNSSCQTVMTRHPGVAGQTVTGTSAGMTDPGHSSAMIAVSQTIPFTTGPDKLHDNKSWAYETVLVYSSTTIQSYGYIRGKLKKVAQLPVPATGTVTGDTYTMGGTKWVVTICNNAVAMLNDTGAP